MSWISLLQPDLILDGNILTLTPERVMAYGLQGLILDVDETLLPSSAGQVSPELKDWVDTFRPRLKLWLVTNNLNLPRIQRISEELDLPFYLGAAKPSRRKLRQAMESMNLPIQSLGIVGDRLFTDVLGGNRLGLFTILVEPIEPSQSYLKPSYIIRQLELKFSRLLGMKIH
jgi:HAD superfamily phosphatase (TIGR01668 family)